MLIKEGATAKKKLTAIEEPKKTGVTATEKALPTKQYGILTKVEDPPVKKTATVKKTVKVEKTPIKKTTTTKKTTSSAKKTTTETAAATTPVNTAPSAELTSALQDLIAQYNAVPSYTPKTAEELRTQATGEYQSYYDQLRRAAQFQQERSDLALQQQRDALQSTYDKQREASQRNYANMYSQADRQMLSRGMQRSSYGAQTLANINEESQRAQSDLWEAQAAAEGNIDAQRTQLAEQLAAQLMGYDADQAADVMNRIRELEEQDYERGLNAQNTKTSLATQLYQMMYQANRDTVADRQWQAQFDESVRQFNETHKKSSGGGGGRSTKKTTTPTTTQTPANTALSYDDMVKLLDQAGNPKTPTTPAAIPATQKALTYNPNSASKNVATTDPKITKNIAYTNSSKNANMTK